MKYRLDIKANINDTVTISILEIKEFILDITNVSEKNCQALEKI